MLKGKPASSGIAFGKIFKLEVPKLNIKKTIISDIEKEIFRLNQAVTKATADIEKLIIIATKTIGAKKAAIFNAHKQIIQDPVMFKETKDLIRIEKINADYAFNQVANKYIALFTNMKNKYVQERVTDIKDVTRRILLYILNIPLFDLRVISEDSIIVARDLAPSQITQLNSFVKGFVTASGSKTAHSTIMARSLELPAIVGLSKILEQVNHGEAMTIDGDSGEVVVNPSLVIIKQFKIKQKLLITEKIKLQKLINKPSQTLDGHQVEISGNIGGINDLKGIIKNGGEGIGLFRTEFLYLNSSDWPTENEQFKVYKLVLEKMANKPVVIRTLDIGGDKKLSYYTFPEEMNPFLGYGALRMCLDKVDIFKTQLRALLRASIFGNLKIMFPMVATIDEFKAAKVILNEVVEELRIAKIKISDNYQVGMMMETPGAIMLADKFVKYADFFSVGTNDLAQYTFAADRTNHNVAHLHQPLNPALLRMLKILIKAAHKKKKWVGICGEMASNPLAIPILLGLGFDGLSMTATAILKTRFIVNNYQLSKAKELTKQALDLETIKEVEALVKKEKFV